MSITAVHLGESFGFQLEGLPDLVTHESLATARGERKTRALHRPGVRRRRPVKVATESHAIDEVDFERLAGHGFGDEDIWDIGAITTFFSYGNRMANLIDMRPNDEFYLLGRSRA